MGRVTHPWVSAKSLPLACPQVRRLTQRDRQEQSHRRRRAQTGHYHLARACHRQTLCRPRCRLLRPPNRPRGRNPPTHRQTPGPRTHRHHRTRSLKPPNDQIRLRRMASPCPVTLDSRTSQKTPGASSGVFIPSLLELHVCSVHITLICVRIHVEPAETFEDVGSASLSSCCSGHRCHVGSK